MNYLVFLCFYRLKDQRVLAFFSDLSRSVCDLKWLKQKYLQRDYHNNLLILRGDEGDDCKKTLFFSHFMIHLIPIAK